MNTTCVWFRYVPLVTLLIAGTIPVAAQNPVFRSGVEMVSLTVTVTDPRGGYVTELGADDFQVFEDGVPQSVAFFTSDRIPVDLSIVLDLSGSMTAHTGLIREAANQLVSMLRKGDRAGLAAVRTYTSVLQPLTTDHREVSDALQQLSAWGATALYDGIYIALRDLQRHRKASEVRKQVIVLLSDGVDTRSHVGFDDITKLSAQLGAAIYVIAAPLVEFGHREDADRMRRARFDLSQLGRDSGGRVFNPAKLEELPAVCAAIAHEMANQYEIAYVPQRHSKTRGFRQVSVRVENAVARTRAGYVASPAP